MKYHRLQLLFTPSRAGGYTVHALTPMGQGRGHFKPPWPGGNAAPLAPTLQREPLRDLTLDSTAPGRSQEAMGEQLFEALFQDEILRLYERSLDLLAANAETGLRIELTFDPRDPDLAVVQTLPWELLRQPGTSKFLALSRSTPITRFLAVPRPVYAAARPQTLRILAVAANQHDSKLPPLELAEELRNLQKAVGSTAHVIPVVPTLAALCQALRDQECHVLHFMGHGGSPTDQKERVLLFNAEDGSPDPVTGTDLANALADFPSLRLVVLNACDSASVRETGASGMGFDPYSGVANALVLGDMPAVIGMQSPIFDATAITFSRAFYQQLAAGLLVDAAVTEGRRAVHSEHRGSLEWATPVLFMRTPTGELFPEEDLWDRPSGKQRTRWGPRPSWLSS